MELRILLGSVRVYAETAFPPGCVDCQLAARDALLRAAQEMEQAYADTGGGPVPLNRRLRALCRYAVEQYPAEDAEEAAARRSLLGMLTLRRQATAP